MKTRKEARERGKKVKKMLPKGWKLEIWENLGWHFKLTKGPISVSQSYDDSFHVLISDYGGHPGSGGGAWSSGLKAKKHKTPQAAIRSGFKSMQNYAKTRICELNKVLNLASEAMKGI